MLGIKSKKGAVLNHWIAFADGFSFQPQEFYTAFEKQLEIREVPGLDVDHIEFGEGGFLSDRRLYLRMVRERLAFDLCAAPFGSGYFFSCRSVEIPVVIRLWHLLAVFAFFFAIFAFLSRPLGFIYSAIAVVALVAALVQVMRNTWNFGVAHVDRLLTHTTVIGPIYERWFRPETYYREDTRLMYLDLIPKLVKELAEETTAAKGVKLTRQYQWAPVLGELYRPLKVPGKDDMA
jgi:hypothetical protein